MMKVEEIGCWSDALYLMESRGLSKEDATEVALQIFNWGVRAACDRMRPSRPMPTDVPQIGAAQLRLVETPAPAKPAKLAGKTKIVNARFEEFWAAYPRREGKMAAIKSYERALAHATPEAILAGAQRYARERANEDPKFTAHPSTWLNAGRWADESHSQSRGFL